MVLKCSEDRNAGPLEGFSKELVHPEGKSGLSGTRWLLLCTSQLEALQTHAEEPQGQTVGARSQRTGETASTGTLVPLDQESADSHDYLGLKHLKCKWI